MKKNIAYVLLFLAVTAFVFLTYPSTIKAKSWTDENGIQWMYDINGEYADNVYIKMISKLENTTIVMPALIDGKYKVWSIGRNTKGIKDEAFFQGRPSFLGTNITIDASSCPYLTTVNKYVFYNNSNSHTFKLPATVTTIQSGAFSGYRIAVYCSNPNLTYERDSEDESLSLPVFHVPEKSSISLLYPNNVVTLTDSELKNNIEKSGTMQFILHDNAADFPMIFSETYNLTLKDGNYHLFAFKNYEESSEKETYLKLSKVSIPSKEHFIFDGFYTKAEGGVKIINENGEIESGNLSKLAGDTVVTYCKYFLSVVLEAVTMALAIVVSNAFINAGLPSFTGDYADWAKTLIYQCELQNYTVTTMLANSEFVAILKQANTDSSKMAEVIGVSEAQLRFVTNTASGMGLIKRGPVVIPFDNQISKDTDL